MENFVFLAGHVGADPEVRTTNSGSKVANFRIATSRPKRDSEGRVLKDDKGYRVEDTEWHRITAFNGQATSVEKGLKKGMKVAVRGRLHNTEWTDRESGQKRYSYEIIAEEISFLSRTKAGTSGRDAGDDDSTD